MLSLLLLAGLVNAGPTKRQALATVYSSCTKPNVAALTFDDGPYIYNGQILSDLAQYNAKATFFFNGNNYDCIYSSDTIARVKAVYAAGHQVGSHTWSHADLTSGLSNDQIADGMYRMEEAFARIIGIKPAFMRPPFGDYNNQVRQVAGGRGQALALWDWDTGDADGNSTAQSEAVYQDAVNAGVSNMLVLNHETIPTTASTVIPYALNLLRNNGYQFVTMAECLGVSPYQQVGTPQSQTSAWTCDGTPDPGAVCGGSIACKTGVVNVQNGGGGGGGGGGSNTPQSNIWIHPLGSSAPTKCLTAASNSNNAAVTISDCVSGSASQLWSVTASGITIYGGAMCLDVTSGNSANGNKMQIYSCSGGNTNQLWSVSGSTIQWTNTGSCLDDTSGSTTNGNPVQIWGCTGGPNQQWNIAAPSGGGGGGGTTGKSIKPGSSSSTCLTVANNANNAAVSVSPCVSGSASQSWTVASNGQLQIYGGALCLDVPSGSTANGVKMQVYACTAGNTNQLWTVTSANQIQWRTHTNECLDLTNGSTASGNVVQLWSCVSGNTNQVWNIV